MKIKILSHEKYQYQKSYENKKYFKKIIYTLLGFLLTFFNSPKVCSGSPPSVVTFTGF